MNPHLERVRADMERAKRDAEDAKRVYNQKAKVFNDQLARYEKARYDELETRLVLEREAHRARKNGDAQLAALLRM